MTNYQMMLRRRMMLNPTAKVELGLSGTIRTSTQPYAYIIVDGVQYSSPSTLTIKKGAIVTIHLEYHYLSNDSVLRIDGNIISPDSKKKKGDYYDCVYTYVAQKDSSAVFSLKSKFVPVQYFYSQNCDITTTVN